MRARRIGKWVLRIVLGVVALALLLVGAGYVTVHTDWGREQVRKQVVKAMAGLFVGKVSIARVEGDVLGDVVLKGIEIDDASGKPAVRVATLRVDFSLLPLIGQTIQIDHLRVEGL